MSILPDWKIAREIKIEPFAECQARPGVISYGVSAYGYDVRVGYKFKVFTNVWGTVIDPKNFDPRAFVDVDRTPKFKHLCHLCEDGEYRCGYCQELGKNLLLDEICPKSNHKDHILIPPNSFALAETIETFEIPRDILAVCLGKSTYARCGIIVNITPLEPEWRGKITIEISNTAPLPAKVYAGEGIAQILFFRAEEVCKISYADKKGRYQDQTGLTLPKVQQ